MAFLSRRTQATHPRVFREGWKTCVPLSLLLLVGFAFGTASLEESRGQPVPRTQPVVNAPSHVDLEAVFLYHFTQFVEWPGEAFSSTNSPLVIGLLGDHPVANV